MTKFVDINQHYDDYTLEGITIMMIIDAESISKGFFI